MEGIDADAVAGHACDGEDRVWATPLPPLVLGGALRSAAGAIGETSPTPAVHAALVDPAFPAEGVVVPAR
eukprot:12237011-Alexandrium_andersonii.AAC.1